MSTRRLFFALWLPAPVAEALHRTARTLVQDGGGRAMRAETLHLTLAFLGDVEVARLPELEALGARAAATATPFTLDIDHLGHWSHNRIDWAGPQQTPDGLLALAGKLREALAAAGFAVEPRSFAPHVTLARKRTSAQLPTPFVAQHVPVDELRLVESRRDDGGAHYAAIGRWRLGRSTT